MSRINLLSLVALLAAALGGCRTESVQPAPDVIPAAGMLIKTESLPLSGDFELRRYELLRARVSNDFYPLNVSSARRVDRLMPKLFVRRGSGWKLLDFANLPMAEVGDAPNLSLSRRQIVYERPDVDDAEGDWPVQYPHDRRTSQVVIYDAAIGQKFLLEQLAKVYGLGQASYWRPGGQQLAFTSLCVQCKPAQRGLVVLEACGTLLADPIRNPELAGLEFIAYSPDGGRIAALRTEATGVGGRRGGTLVEVDPAAKTVRDVGPVSAMAACRHLGRMEEMLRWKDGKLQPPPAKPE